jgi:methylated-DNA-[protein]-cysteine S-methyltransferase
VATDLMAISTGEGILVWSAFDTPVGSMIAVRSPRGIVALAFDGDHAVAEAEVAYGSRAHRDDRALAALRAEVRAYFDGERRTFTHAPDLVGIEGFTRRVIEAARMIPFGSVATYGQLAGRAGSSRAARAAGSAMARNRTMLLVPCHRVVPADGTVGGYSGREDRKILLLEHEATVLGSAREGG